MYTKYSPLYIITHKGAILPFTMGVREFSLNQKQLELLKHLYTFRFATTELLTQHVGLKDSTYIHHRLSTLRTKGYIDRYFSQDYKLLHKPAVYYLLPKAFPLLRNLDNVSPLAVRSLYKDKSASERFIIHNLRNYRTFIVLRDYYGPKLWFYTPSGLKFPKYSFLPKPLPNALLSMQFGLNPPRSRTYFFLILCSSEVPLFAHLKRLKQYISYRDSGDWEANTNTTISGVLFVTDTEQYQSILIKKMAQRLAVEGVDDDLSYFITTESNMNDLAEAKGIIWRSVAQPTVMRSLERM